MATSGCRPRVAAALLLLVLCLLPPTARAQRLDTELEKLLGKPLAWGMVETSGSDTDPLLLNWVRGIGALVSAQAPRRDIPYTFGILGTDTANAYALPGGYIFVTRGLLDVVGSDDELASVLAHESGHVAKRHATQLIGGNLLFNLLLGAVKGRRYEDAKTVAQAVNLFRTLHKSREMEFQADAEGVRYTAAAGYDPNGLARFLERLAAGQNEPGRFVQYFATHPAPQRRLESVRRDPRLRLDDPALRERIAAGYAARGLPGAARAVRRGDDPLLAPAPPGRALPPSLAGERQALADQSDTISRGLGAPYRTQRVGGHLRQILLLNHQIGDYRWLYLALRAYALQTNAEDIYERSVRALRTAAPTYDALAAYPDDRDAARGRDEVRRALERLGGAPDPLRRTSRATLAVLADLNNPLYHPRGNAAWARYGTLEGLLRHAEAELSRADRASGQAWRLLALARIRRYEVRLSELVPEADTPRRALWEDLLTRRLGRSFLTDGPSGPATVRAALAVQLGESAAAVGAERGEMPWADWVLERRGIPENIATVMRLLTLDLERETAAQEERET